MSTDEIIFKASCSDSRFEIFSTRNGDIIVQKGSVGGDRVDDLIERGYEVSKIRGFIPVQFQHNNVFFGMSPSAVEPKQVTVRHAYEEYREKYIQKNGASPEPYMDRTGQTEAIEQFRQAALARLGM